MKWKVDHKPIWWEPILFSCQPLTAPGQGPVTIWSPRITKKAQIPLPIIPLISSGKFLDKHWVKCVSFLDVTNQIHSRLQRIASETGTSWQCSECYFQSKIKTNVLHHIESFHVQHDGYYCLLCDKTCPTKNAFRMHNKRNHSDVNNQELPIHS